MESAASDERSGPDTNLHHSRGKHDDLELERRRSHRNERLSGARLMDSGGKRIQPLSVAAFRSARVFSSETVDIRTKLNSRAAWRFVRPLLRPLLLERHALRHQTCSLAVVPDSSRQARQRSGQIPWLYALS